MTTFLRKTLFAVATFASIAVTGLVTAEPAAASGWDRGYERGWDNHSGRNPPPVRWERHREWRGPRCWIDHRRVWVRTPWGPERRMERIRVCR